jgi:Domain of unknown function (DUF1772)
MKKIFLFTSIILASGLLVTNIYNSLVDARSWGADLPLSVETARQYFKNVNPGNFYRLFSPINQVLVLLCVILFWKAGKQARLYLIIAFLIYVLADVFTFAYFYPRNAILFSSNTASDTEGVKTAWQQWSSANWLRSFLAFAGIIFSCMALDKIYRRIFELNKK